MATVVMTRTINLVSIECGKCGIVFAVPDDWQRRRQNEHDTFYCPNGDPRAYKGDSEADRLRRDLDWYKDRDAALTAERDQLAASLRTTKGVVTKMRKRAIVGACQFCHRNFANVARHVATKHPDETPEAVG